MGCYVSLRPLLHVPWFLECDGWDIWRICIVALFGPVQFLLFESLRLLVNERLLLLCASHAHSLSLGYRCFRDNRPQCAVSESCCTKCFNDLVVPSDSSQFCSISCWFGAACPPFLVAEHCFQPSVSSHSVRVGIRVVDPAH